MIVVRGRARTTQGAKYLVQLCKHWAHRFDVDVVGDRGRIVFPSGSATLEAAADALIVTLETDDPTSVDAFKATLVKHLDRFAFREAPLLFIWSQGDGA